MINKKLAQRPLNTIFTSWSFGLKNKQARGDYLVKMVKKTQGLRPVDHLVPYRNDSYLTKGLSLRAGGRGFPPAAQSMAPSYFRH